MSVTNIPTPCPARAAAISQLRSEHRLLARVIEALETLVAEIAEDLTAPDFALLAAMLYYVDAVPERLHHPKEDQYLFAALRKRDPDAAALLDRLEREHQRSPHLVGELERALVHWQGGAPDGLNQFALALGNFSEFHWAHMRLEENEIFPRAERSLPESDWLAIAEAFGANEEPLFGTHRRKEFERPYQRIANLAPRKLKLSRRDPV
jgi:hemerythrin-like domain-containing protein